MLSLLEVVQLVDPMYGRAAGNERAPDWATGVSWARIHGGKASVADMLPGRVGSRDIVIVVVDSHDGGSVSYKLSVVRFRIEALRQRLRCLVMMNKR